MDDKDINGERSTVRVSASTPSLNNKILFKIDPDLDTVYWYIKFNLLLDENTVAPSTMYVTDLDGYLMRTTIKYSQEYNVISISPIDTYAKDRYYILQITKGVKGLSGGSLRKNVNILFKLNGSEVADYKILESNVVLPEPKQRPIEYNPEDVVTKVYEIDTEQLNKDGKDNLQYLPYKINPFIGIIGLLVIIVGILSTSITMSIIGIGVSFLGCLHLSLQLLNNEKRAAYIYNTGVRHFREQEYDKAKAEFIKAFELDQYNEYIEFAVNRIKYYEQ